MLVRSFGFFRIWQSLVEGNTFAFLTRESNPVCPNAIRVIFHPKDYGHWLSEEEVGNLAVPFSIVADGYDRLTCQALFVVAASSLYRNVRLPNVAWILTEFGHFFCPSPGIPIFLRNQPFSQNTKICVWLTGQPDIFAQNTVSGPICWGNQLLYPLAKMLSCTKHVMKNGSCLILQLLPMIGSIALSSSHRRRLSPAFHRSSGRSAENRDICV